MPWLQSMACIPTSEDIHKLREPLSFALTSLLVRQILRATWEIFYWPLNVWHGVAKGKPPTTILSCVSSQWRVSLRWRSPWWATMPVRYPAIAQQNLATLFPFLVVDEVLWRLPGTVRLGWFWWGGDPSRRPPKRTTRNKQPKRNKEGKGQKTKPQP